MSRPLRHRLGAFQQLLVMLALAGFLAGTLGVPVPRAIGLRKDRSEPFPCMDRQCGCQSAAQCWRGCCCFTNRQKLAWAHERGVAPPEFVVQATKREQATAASCCNIESRKVAYSDSSCEDEHHDLEPTPSVSFGFVLAAQARQCQGQAALWLALGAVAPLPPKTQVEHDELVLGTACIAAEKLSGISQRPVTPPPRV